MQLETPSFLEIINNFDVKELIMPNVITPKQTLNSIE